MSITSFSDILILLFAVSIQILIGVALVKAGQKYYQKSKTEQSGRILWIIIGVVISICGWSFTLWAIVYTATQIIKSI